MDERYLYSFLLSLILALVLIPLLIRRAAAWGLVDDPSGESRKIHSESVPRIGGLGIILASAVSVFLVLPFDNQLLGFVLASFVIILFGLLDDLFQLSPKYKLLGQALCITVAMSGGMVFRDLPFIGDGFPLLSYLVTFVFVMGVINGCNFLDGMDGLAAGATMMALVLLFILAISTGNTTVAAISLAVSASLLGFLRFNTHPARVFMGDTGSQFLGFVVAWLAITVSQAPGSGLSPLLPLLVLGIPAMDILQVLPVRKAKRLPWAGPDKEHFHHHILKLGFYQYEVVAIIYVTQFLLLSGAYLLRTSSNGMVLSFYLSFVVLSLSIIFVATRFEWRVRAPAGDELFERRNVFFRRLSGLHPYTDSFLISMVGTLLVVAALLSPQMSAVHPVIVAIFVIACAAATIFLRGIFPLMVGRLVCYAAVIFLMNEVTHSEISSAVNTGFDAALAVLGIVLFVSIRITRRSYFGLTNEDLLVVIFFIALAPIMTTELNQGTVVIRLIFRICILLYACEYILARGKKSRQSLTTMSAIALVLSLLPTQIS